MTFKCQIEITIVLYYSDVNWNWVDEETKAELGLQSKDDGEFWMSYKDFCKHFSEITLCLTGPDFDGDGISDHPGYNCSLSI